jgi:hypothetical protein
MQIERAMSYIRDNKRPDHDTSRDEKNFALNLTKPIVFVVISHIAVQGICRADAMIEEDVKDAAVLRLKVSKGR